MTLNFSTEFPTLDVSPTATNVTSPVQDYDYGCGESCPEPMPKYQKVLITFAYGLIISVAIFGNSSVCYVVYKYQRLHTTTNYFIVNLAVSDILMAVLCIPFTFMANLILGYWPFGRFMCPTVFYCQAVAVFLSAFTLVAISLDRFFAIVTPLRPKLSERQTYIIIASVWTLAMSVALPIAILSRVVEKPDVLSRDVMPFCEEQWSSQSLKKAYSLVVMTFQYFLPLAVLWVTYTWIGFVIWSKQPPGEITQRINREERQTRSKRKVSCSVT